jgi:hypothetical protein
VLVSGERSTLSLLEFEGAVWTGSMSDVERLTPWAKVLVSGIVRHVKDKPGQLRLKTTVRSSQRFARKDGMLS